MKRTINIVDYVTDPELLGLTLSAPQETLLRSIYGLPLSDEQLEIYHTCTDRAEYLGASYAEATILCGARAGKDSRIAAPMASFEAVFGRHEKHLVKGERGVIPLVAPNGDLTKIAFGYIRSHFEDSKLLASMVDDINSNEIQLTNRMSIVCFSCTKSALRGWSIPLAILDEPAFFRLEGAVDSDVEVQASIRRGMIGFATTRLVKISTPYMKSGLLYDDFRSYFGKDSQDLLCWRAPSAFMNPSLKMARLEREKRLDPIRFSREYEAEFAEDVDAFLPVAWVEQAIIPGRTEVPPKLDEHSYTAAVDVSGLGGSVNSDAFTLSIAHVEGDRVIQDLCRGWKKTRSNNIDLTGIVDEIARILKAYGRSEVSGDRYGAGWVVEAFAKAGVHYTQTEQDKSEYYVAIEPIFAQGRIDLLDHQQQERELKSLERRPRQGGKVTVDHPSRGHDDYANSLAIAAAHAIQNLGDFDVADFGERVVTDEVWTSEFHDHSRAKFWDA